MQIGFLIDPPTKLAGHKDSTIELMRATQAAEHEIILLTQDGLYIENGVVKINGRKVRISDNSADWQEFESDWHGAAEQLGLIWLRLEPPVDARFRNSCAKLCLVADSGTRVINHPAAVLAWEEKITATRFPELSPATCISSDREQLLRFAAECGDCVVKPLGGFGGGGVFAFKANDSNIASAINLHLSRGDVIVQQSANLSDGDARVFIIDDKPAEFELVRYPTGGSHLANMDAGGKPVARPLTEVHRKIAEQIAPKLNQVGILFAGIDIIGDLLTEVNVTCPTGLVQVRQQSGIDLASQIINLSG